MKTLGVIALLSLALAGSAAAQSATPPAPAAPAPAVAPAAPATPPAPDYHPLADPAAPNPKFKMRRASLGRTGRSHYRGGTPISSADPDIRIDSDGQVVSSPEE